MHLQDTRIHSRSLELIELVRDIVKAMPPGHADLANQLKRAASSIGLNFAEGFGRVSPKERVRFFTIARGSAAEVAMIFDVAHAFGIIDDATRIRGKDLCDHLGGMLYNFR